MELADGSGDELLRMFARRMGCVVFGNMAVASWPERLQALPDMTITRGWEPWEEAMSRNDLAHLRMEQGDVAEVEAELARAEAVASRLERQAFALAVISCTRAEVGLRAERPQDAPGDAGPRGRTPGGDGRAEPVPARHGRARQGPGADGAVQVDDVLAAGEEALERLGERVPQARSMILGTIATFPLRDAGRAEQLDVLQRCVEVERAGMRELSELQLGLERARIEMELLRDQAERDPLTGLHNRRYLHQTRDIGGPVALAVLDIDHFKAVNDRLATPSAIACWCAWRSC